MLEIFFYLFLTDFKESMNPIKGRVELNQLRQWNPIKLVQRIKGISQIGVMFKDFWKGVHHLFLRFETIVKHDDRTINGISYYILKALLCRYGGIKITTEHIPHDNSVRML